ncbi:MAG: hypothetical protein E6I78_05870 [Chloroflexi bacterium]|nr:MAG: hypothetical protein E6I78_05870 [Chloroflexota bacterium]
MAIGARAAFKQAEGDLATTQRLLEDAVVLTSESGMPLLEARVVLTSESGMPLLEARITHRLGV